MAQAEHESTYSVSAEKFYLAVTQYENYPEFVDGMKKVRVEKGVDGSIVGHYDLSMMSKDMSYVLKIQESPSTTPKTVSWSLIRSEFFKVNNGKWTIQPLGENQCKVHYSLEVEFSFSVPSFILKGIVKGTLPTVMNGFFERAKKLS